MHIRPPSGPPIINALLQIDISGEPATKKARTNGPLFRVRQMPPGRPRDLLMAAAHFRAEKLRAEAEKRDINWEVALEKYSTDAFSWNGDKPKSVVVFWSYKKGAAWCHEATEMNYKQLLL